MSTALLYPNMFKKFLPYLKDHYEFGFCSVNEIDEVIEFINLYWKKGHAMAVSRSLMDWQHYDKVGNRYLFSIARHKESGQIHALQGFITSKLFDPSIENMVLWGSIWKTRDDVAIPGLGAMVEGYAMQSLNPHTVAGLGKSVHSIKISKRHGDYNAKTNRYYILNDKSTSYTLCKPNMAPISSPCKEGNDRFVSLSIEDYRSCNGSVFNKILPYKSKKYYVKRYYQHPIYQYSITGIKAEDDDIRAIVFWRVCNYKGRKCIRVVDYIGDGSELKGNLCNFQNLLYETDAEFIDFIQYGFSKQAFLDGGWVDIADTDVVLAHYFEPFVLENVDLAFNFKSKDTTLSPMIFKGDADQDRPNVII